MTEEQGEETSDDQESGEESSLDRREENGVDVDELEGSEEEAVSGNSDLKSDLDGDGEWYIL